MKLSKTKQLTEEERKIEEAKKLAIDQEKTNEVLALVNTFSQLSGLRFFLELLKWVFTGMFMGASDAIPGYSGGTTLALLGFFKRLIFISKSVFIPEKGLTRLRALAFMLPFGIGWIGGVFGIAKLTEFLAGHGMGLELMFFFSAFITFAIPIFIKSENPKLHVKDKTLWRRWAYFLVGFCVVLGLAIFTFKRGGVPFHGTGKGEDKSSEDVPTTFNLKHEWWQLVLVAYGAGMVTLIPGGSGAIVQLLAGFYGKIHWVIMAHAFDSPINIAGLAVFAGSTFVGMVTMVFIFSWLFKHRENDLAALSFGMLIVSIVAILIVPEKSLWNGFTRDKYHGFPWHDVTVPMAWILGLSAALGVQLFIKFAHRRQRVQTVTLK